VLRKLLPALLALAFLALLTPQLWSQEPEEKPAPKPDPTGANTGDSGLIGEKLEPKVVGDHAAKTRIGLNLTWILITGFLVMFMQAGFALVETGLTRAKNVAHTMAMNFMVYAIGMLGFWAVGFAIMFGGTGNALTGLLGGSPLLTSEFTIEVSGAKLGIFGYDGFCLVGHSYDVALMALFLFQMVFMDTTATIPTGAMAERWKFLPFVIFGFFVSTILYPVYGNWVWGGGWLSQLGSAFGIGHGHVDFAGSSVVHMTGGFCALAGAIIIGPRIGKFNKDGTVNALPAHSVPMYMLGTFILAFGWFGFNPGSSWNGADMINARSAVNTMLASAAGAFMSMVYMWLVYKKPDPSFMCNGMLAGLVAITAPCAFVTPVGAVGIGAVAGVLVVWSCLFVERVLKLDDPVGAISVHGVNGAWGILALGLLADGTYGIGWNGSHWIQDGSALKWVETVPEGATEVGVTGLLYGNTGQILGSLIGIAANVLWVFPVSLVFFWVVEKVIGNRVSPEVELQGLDVPEMGVLGYINEDPKAPEGHVLHASAEPRSARVPPDGKGRFTVVVEGVDPEVLAEAWSKLCSPGPSRPAAEFLAVYPYMTSLQGTRFRFRGGDPGAIRTQLLTLLRNNLDGAVPQTRVE
jgi:ammonium transporter, Amt family